MDSTDTTIWGYWAIGSGIHEHAMKSIKCFENAGEGTMQRGLLLVQPCSQASERLKEQVFYHQ